LFFLFNFQVRIFVSGSLQCLAEKLAVSLSEIRKAALVFLLDELQKSLIHGLKGLKICHNLQHQKFQNSQSY